MSCARIALACAVLASLSTAQRTILVDLRPTGGTPAAGAAWPSPASGGASVVFESAGPDLAPGDANGFADIFVRDTQTGQFEIASRATNGAQGDGDSRLPRASPDGRFVVFTSTARNLSSPSELGSTKDVFLRDRTLGTTVPVSRNALGGESNGASDAPDVSDDGRFVSFHSAASDLVPNDTNGAIDVFVRDLVLGTTQLVSVSTGGASGNDNSYFAGISGNGRYVVFESQASDLVAGDTNADSDVFVRDLSTGATVRASVSSSGAEGNSYSTSGSISADGRFVAFGSAASNLVTPDVGGWLDILVRDMTLGTTVRASQSASGAQANYSSWSPSLSTDGRHIAFLSGALNLVSPSSLFRAGVALVDLATGNVQVAAVSTCGLPIDQLVQPMISPDGTVVAFASKATHAAPDDVNDTYDVFLHDPAAPPSSSPCRFCVIAPTSHGCLPALTASGTPSISAGSGFVLSVASVEGGRMGLFFQGGFSATSPLGFGGPSYMCVFPLERFGLQLSGGTKNACDGSLSFDWNSRPGGAVLPGRTAFVQAWFRDPSSAQSTHWSDAIAFIVGP